ncbi:hypothetical protein D3C87_1885120 [compost metagenome]
MIGSIVAMKRRGVNMIEIVKCFYQCMIFQIYSLRVNARFFYHFRFQRIQEPVHINLVTGFYDRQAARFQVHWYAEHDRAFDTPVNRDARFAEVFQSQVSP